MRIKSYCFIGTILIFLCAACLQPCSASGLIQEVENAGIVDWARLVIRCTGVGISNPDTAGTPKHLQVIRSAREDAFGKIIKILRSIAITSDLSAGEFLDEQESLGNRIRALVENFREKSVHYMSDGSVEIEVELSLRGGLMDFLLPPSGSGRRIPDGLLCPLCGQPWPQDKEVPQDLKLNVTGEDLSEPFTGLVIDARGQGLRPALAPRVLNESGKIVYGVSFTRRPRALVAGVASYEGDLDLASKKNRVAEKPLIVQCKKAVGPDRTDIIISSEAAAILHSMPKHLKFLADCRVIIVVE